MDMTRLKHSFNKNGVVFFIYKKNYRQDDFAKILKLRSSLRAQPLDYRSWGRHSRLTTDLGGIGIRLRRTGLSEKLRQFSEFLTANR